MKTCTRCGATMTPQGTDKFVCEYCGNIVKIEQPPRVVGNFIGRQAPVAPPPPPKPDSFMVWSILATALCCVPTGIVAIIQSNKVNALWNDRDYDGAQEAANKAKTWCWISLALGIVAGIIAIFSGILDEL